jgi:hypothetical protein
MPAARSWTMESVLEALSDEPLSLMASSSSVFSGAANDHTSVFSSSSELQQRERSSPQSHLYLAQHPLFGPHRHGTASTLYHDAPLPLLPLSIKNPDAQVTSVNLWLCINLVRSSLHYDSEDNLLCIIRGAKRITLYPPHCTPWLYPRSVADDGSVNHSCIDLSLEDEDEVRLNHPLYRLAQRHKREIDVKEGDGVFIPSGWWHQVDSISHTIAINYWWPASESPLNDRKTDSFYQLRDCFGSCQPQMIELMIQQAMDEASEGCSGHHPQQPTDDASAFEIFRGIITQGSLAQHAQEALACFLFKLSSQEFSRLLLYVSEHHSYLISLMFSTKLTPLASFFLTSRLEGLEDEHQNGSGTLTDLSTLYSSFYAASGMAPEEAYQILLDGRKRCMQEAARRLIHQVLGITS